MTSHFTNNISATGDTACQFSLCTSLQTNGKSGLGLRVKHLQTRFGNSLWSSSSSSFPRQALARIQNITCSYTLPSQRSFSWWHHFSCSFPVGAERLDRIRSVLPEEAGHFPEQVAHWRIASSSGGAIWIGMLLCIGFSVLVQSIPVTWTSSEACKTPFQTNGGCLACRKECCPLASCLHCALSPSFPLSVTWPSSF